MKMSEYFRKWQLSGELPEVGDPELAFWAGWIFGTPTGLVTNFDDRREIAIRACEFIEKRALQEK